jgi:TIR domain
MSAESHANPTRIYLSFADEDRARAMALVRWLNDGGWRVVADDRHSFAAGDRWSRGLRLDSCDVILCLVTPGWLVSTHCHDEYSYCAKHGKFVVPVICELPDLDLLPEGMRALPRVDLTQGRLDDYLLLKDTLRQVGSRIGAMLAAEKVAARRRRRRLRLVLWPLLAAALVTVAALAWLWLLR